MADLTEDADWAEVDGLLLGMGDIGAVLGAVPDGWAKIAGTWVKLRKRVVCPACWDSTFDHDCGDYEYVRYEVPG